MVVVIYVVAGRHAHTHEYVCVYVMVVATCVVVGRHGGSLPPPLRLLLPSFLPSTPFIPSFLPPSLPPPFLPSVLPSFHRVEWWLVVLLYT